jgi:hypothetical protein
MFNAKLTHGQCHDLATILDRMPPAGFETYKAQRLHGKLVEKFTLACNELAKLLDSLEMKLATPRSLLQTLKRPEDANRRAAVEAEMAETAQPIVDKANKLRLTATKVEMSDEEISYLRSIFFEHISKNMTTTRLAIAIGDAIGFGEAEAEEQAKAKEAKKAPAAKGKGRRK